MGRGMAAGGIRTVENRITGHFHGTELIAAVGVKSLFRAPATVPVDPRIDQLTRRAAEKGRVITFVSPSFCSYAIHFILLEKPYCTTLASHEPKVFSS